MTFWQNYHLANDITDALQTLADAPGEASFIAGGTDLLLDIQQGRHPHVHTLIDVTQIPELCQLEVREKDLYIGAAVPLNRVKDSPVAQWHARALAEAAALIGGPQVRNTATLGGNVGTRCQQEMVRLRYWHWQQKLRSPAWRGAGACLLKNCLQVRENQL